MAEMVQLCSLDRYQMSIYSKQVFNDYAPYGTLLESATLSVLQHPDARAQALKGLISGLPAAPPVEARLNNDRVIIGRPGDLSAEQLARVEKILIGLKPWRKGPFELFGIQIDSEWNSALKWRRVAPHMASLAGRRVLDVGSSNGYYLFRMAAHRPRFALGIEPYAAYYYQFLALQFFSQIPGIHNLPLKLEDLDGISNWFDTVFCMGILYHRRSPLDTLAHLKRLLTTGGQLILETLVIQGKNDTALFPRDRYACMRNVYFIPTVHCLQNWLVRCGFGNIRCVDVTPTTTEEQRKTPWIDSDSLDAFLDPANRRMTREGYPAPVRAVVIAEST
jgi:tRNA (mo5U34)-methyltransferase